MDKPKRHRRTKKEMEAARSMGLVKKSSLTSNLDVLDYVYDIETKELKDAPKVIKGWVNVYKDSKGSYWLGSDIHYTIEEAKKIASGKYVQQIKISFEEF